MGEKGRNPSLSDGAEAALGTDAHAVDTDGDRLEDFDEVMLQRTDPRAGDTDGDGFVDGLEVAHAYDPLDASSHPSPLPTIVSVVPAPGTRGVSVSAPITITFSEPMDPSDTTLDLTPLTHILGPTWNAERTIITLQPDPAIRFATEYTLAVDSADLEGYPLAGTHVFTFTTEQAAAPLAANGVVQSFVAGPDGTMYLGGDFTRIGRATGGGVPLDAESGALVEPYAEVSGIVMAVASDGAGGWWIGGEFEHVAGLRRRNLAHVRSDGSADAGFDAGIDNAVVEAIAVRGDRVYAAVGTGPGVWALDARTGVRLWAAEVYGGKALLAADGALFVGGSLIRTNGDPLSALVALDPATGELLPGGRQVDGTVYALAWSGSALYAGGTFTEVDGQARSGLAAFDSAFALTDWNPGADSLVDALDWDGTTLYVGGAFQHVGGAERVGLAAIDAAGAVTDWSPAAEHGSEVGSLVVEGDAVYVGGFFWDLAGGAQPRNGLAAYDRTTGALLSWAPYPLNLPVATWSDTWRTHALASHAGVVFAGGGFAGIGGESRNGLAAVDVRGALLPWNPAPGSVFKMVRLGSLIVTARLQAFDMNTGALAWELAQDGSVSELAVDGDVVYICGSFATVAGVPRASLAAIDAHGVVTSWNPGADGPVSALSVSEGIVYAVGGFQNIAGTPRMGGAAIDAAGAVKAWAPTLPGGAVDVFATPDAVYLAGAVHVNGELHDVGGLVALDLAGELLPWTPAIPEPFNASSGRAVVVAGSTAYIGGAFGWSNRGYAHNLAAVDATTGAALPFDHPVFGTVEALAVQGSRLWIGGDFTSVGARPAACFRMLER